MKNQLLDQCYTFSIVAFVLFLFSGCSDDNSDSGPPKPTVEVNYSISTVSGAWPDMTTYIQGVRDLDFNAIDNSSAIELASSGNTTQYNGKVYALPFGAPATLVQYTFNDEGQPVEAERIVVPGANTFSTLYFESETKAFATLAGGISKLIVFDPSTMRIEDEVDLSQISKEFPEATRTYYMDLVERNNKLFMGVYYENNFAPVNDFAHIAIIDMATNTFEKLITDERTGMIFGGPALGTGMIKAANGDIYVQAKGTLDYGGKSPSGILRIKDGETDFDKDYFFDLTEAMGGIAYGIYHFGNGLTFTTHNANIDDFWEFNGGPYYQYYQIDLEGQTAQKVEGIPAGFWVNGLIAEQLNDNELIFTVGTGSENVAYSYDISSGSVSQKFISNGGSITGLKRLD